MYGVGRPQTLVDATQLEYLRSLSFTWSEVSYLGVSVKTLQRRAKEWNIVSYSTITNHDLDILITETLHELVKLCLMNIYGPKEFFTYQEQS